MSTILFLLMTCLVLMHEVRNHSLSSLSHRMWTGCEGRSVPSNICHRMAPANWMFTFDLPMQWGTFLNEYRIPYQAQKRIAEIMLTEATRFVVAPNSQHQVVTLVQDQMLQYIQNCNDTGVSLAIPEFDRLTLQYSGGSIAKLFDSLTQHMHERCRRPTNQRIVIAFVNYITESEALDNQRRSLLRVLQGLRYTTQGSTQVYFVAVNHGLDSALVGNNIYNRLSDYRHNLPIHGNVFVNSHFGNAPPTEAVLTDVANQLLNCACYQSEDCTILDQSRTECYFTLRNPLVQQSEICIRDINNRFNFTPVAPQRQTRSCRLVEHENCTRLDDCLPSCDQKGWTEWSRCIADSTGVGRQNRWRQNATAGRSSFTRTCQRSETRNCTPSSGLPTIDFHTETTTEEIEVIEETNATVTEKITTTSHVPVDDKSHGGFSIVSWIAIGVASLLILLALVASVVIINKRRSSAKKTKLSAIRQQLHNLVSIVKKAQKQPKMKGGQKQTSIFKSKQSAFRPNISTQLPGAKAKSVVGKYPKQQSQLKAIKQTGGTGYVLLGKRPES